MPDSNPNSFDEDDLLEDLPELIEVSEVEPVADESSPEVQGISRNGPGGARRVFSAMPAWLISTIVHVGILLILAAITLDPIRNVLAVVVVRNSTETNDEDLLDDFEFSAADTIEVTDSVEFTPEMPSFDAITPDVQTDVSFDVAIESSLANLSSTSFSQELAPSKLLDVEMDNMHQLLSSRGDRNKRELLEKFGGNANSEKAVAQALRWLAEHQLPDGSWNFTHTVACKNRCPNPGDKTLARNGATGIALLPFLGAGQTHLEGNYQQVVFRGLEFLIRRMSTGSGSEPPGGWYRVDKSRGFDDNLYSHGIASIAMCEAYAMTKDPVLAKPAQLAASYIAYAQNPLRGGWQYTPQQGGDTSAVGWQIMALKSAAMGGLGVSLETLRKAEYFLDSVQSNQGAYYGYLRPDPNLEGTKATTACGLLCRMYMGWPKTHPGLQEGVQWIAKRGPDDINMYYNYYATQVLKQYGGPEWEDWNLKMRDKLVTEQEKEGHVAGSWFYNDVDHGGPGPRGGRLYNTAMAAMTLEVYYRFLPIYNEQTEEDSFKL